MIRLSKYICRITLAVIKKLIMVNPVKKPCTSLASLKSLRWMCMASDEFSESFLITKILINNN